MSSMSKPFGSISRCAGVRAALGVVCCLGVMLGLGVSVAFAGTVIEGESVSEVSASSARLSATVNPGGVPSEYFFEYGPTAAYGTATATTSAGAGMEPVAAFVRLSELQPSTEYHFRVVAKNANGETAQGSDQTFTTGGVFPPAPAGLPDDRGYELVTPYLENANVFTPYERKAPFEVAPDGDAISYKAEPSVEGNGKTALSEGGNAYLATRSADGWSVSVIQPKGLKSPEYEGFTSDLSEGFIESEEPLLEGDEGGGLYSSDLAARGSYSFIAAFTKEKFNYVGENTRYAGSTPDGSHVLVEVPVGENHYESGLYDLVGGRLVGVGVLPDGSPAPADAIFGGPGWEERNQVTPIPQRENGLPDFSHAISEDGSRIFFSTVELVSEEESRFKYYKPTALYVREDDASADARTVQVDGAEPGCGSCMSGGGQFWTASADGSRVYFTDERRLTEDSTAAPGEPDLYVYDVETEKLTDMSVDANPGEHANVQGVVGAGESAGGGAYVYFVANGVLASGASPPYLFTSTGKVYKEPCRESLEGVDDECNLYVAHEGEPPRFITELSYENINNTNDGSLSNRQGDLTPDIGRRTAEVTPDGRDLAFMLGRGNFPTEWKLYVYDAPSEGLTCVSCNPSGGSNGSARVPVSENVTYQPQFISDDGDQVFFENSAQLTQKTGSGVYEWERDGSGSCELSPGCVYLLSQGISGGPYDTGDAQPLLGASASGDDVFFETREQLVPQDGDEDIHIYDARVGAVQPLAPLACTSSGCQGAPLPPPIFATPSSVTFAGVGNFLPAAPMVKKATTKKTVKCAKGMARKGAKCVKQKSRKKAKKAKRVGNERRTGQ